MTTVAIAIHAIAASLVILLAPIQVIRRPKDERHKLIGRTWVIAMYLVCISGMFIYTLSGGFTVFHALAIFTFITTTLGVVQIRRGNVRRHVSSMIGGYLGAIVAGAFAVAVPSRFLPTLAVEHPAVLWGGAAAVVVAATAWLIVVLTLIRPRSAPASPALDR